MFRNKKLGDKKQCYHNSQSKLQVFYPSNFVPLRCTLRWRRPRLSQSVPCRHRSSCIQMCRKVFVSLITLPSGFQQLIAVLSDSTKTCFHHYFCSVLSQIPSQLSLRSNPSRRHPATLNPTLHLCHLTPLVATSESRRDIRRETSRHSTKDFTYCRRAYTVDS